MKQYIIREVKIKYENYKKVEQRKVRTSMDVYALWKELINEEREKFIAIYLNGANDIIAFNVITEGGITSCAPDLRIILRNALLLNATAIILLHNHPSGNPHPSEDDKKYTKTVQSACDTLQLKILDHIIIGDDNYFSFSDEGLI